MIGIFNGWLGSRAYDVWIGLKPSRFGVLTVVLLATLLFETGTEQGRDVLLEFALASPWNDPLGSIWFYAATFFLAVLVWITCRLSSSLRFDQQERDTILRYRRLFPRPPLSPDNPSDQDAIVADADRRLRNILRVRLWAPRILGILVPVVVAGGLVASAGVAGVADAVVCLGLAVLAGAIFLGRRKGQTRAAGWAARTGHTRLAKMLAVQAAAVAEPAAAGQELEPLARRVAWSVVVVVGVSLIAAGFWPLEFGLAFGPLPVTMLALTVILFVGTGIAIASRISNIPWFTILAAAVFGLTFVSGHRMRFVDHGSDAISSRVTPSELLSEFAASEASGTSATPVVLVATAGGGSRAAYWTAAVLGELATAIPGFNDRLLVISGISGGSVGALFYRAALVAAGGDNERSKAIAKDAAAGDFLSPALASLVTRDLIPGLPDRAAAVERAWSRSFDRACSSVLATPCPVDLEHGFLDLWRNQAGWPALVLNGTVVESGGRVVASSLRLDCEGGREPCAVLDVADLLSYERRDLVASTAANVSARFPVIEPSARVKIDRDGTLRSVVDGGYFDIYGAVTLSQIMAELQGALEALRLFPIVIQITSDPEVTVARDGLRGRLDPGKIEPGGHQLLEPFQAIVSAHGAVSRQALLTLEAQAKAVGAYVHFDQCSDTKGRSARAPLAWVLSQASRELLDDTLTYATETCDNEIQMQRVKACFKAPAPGCDGLERPEDGSG